MNEQIMSMLQALEKRITDVDKKYNHPALRNGRGVDENGASILDVADLADENSTAIEELADIIGEILDRVTALEEKEAE